MFVFKTRLYRICADLYSVVDHLQRLGSHMSGFNFMTQKINQDQEDLDSILGHVSIARFSKRNLTTWSHVQYTLTRIEINIGGYKIAIRQSMNDVR